MNAPKQSTFRHDSFKGLIGISRVDITPPVGIYSRNWGAATHDLAESIHRPLTLNAMTFSTTDHQKKLCFVEGDLGWWRSQLMFEKFRDRLLEELSLEPSQLIFALTHTHASVTLTDDETGVPNQELTKKYLSDLYEKTVQVIRESEENLKPSILEWHQGHCQLACNRDFPDPQSTQGRVICGFSPENEADDTLVTGRITDQSGSIRATVTNYGCHPTTLAWENRAISPDYIGAMRETVESRTEGVPAIFMLGACGELSPRYQYVGNTEVADQHGRQLGYSSLATLEDMQPPGTEMIYDRVVDSGAPLAFWKNESRDHSELLSSKISIAKIPLKNWPTADELEQKRLQSDDRAEEERLKRRRNVRKSVGDGTHYNLPVYGWRIGDSVIVGANTEAYSFLQMELRRRHPEITVICLSLINGTIGYLPPEELYDLEIYQVMQTPFDRGSLEIVIETMDELIQSLMSLDEN